MRGTWLRLEIDKKLRVWARMKKTPKISALVFLQALGFTFQEINTGMNFPDFLEESYIKENHPNTTEEALITLYEKSNPTLASLTPRKGLLGTRDVSKTSSNSKEKSQGSPLMGQKFLFRKFMNPRTYDLGSLGRRRLNKKLGVSVSEKQLTLTRHDIFFALDYLINLKYGINSVDDIDHLKNRRVKASGELIQSQVSTGLIRLEKTIREKMKKFAFFSEHKKGLTISSLITTKPINGALREFFGSSPLSQYLDQTNPLAEITHKRRVSSLGPGGISRETAGMAVRGIHPTHYGRICPIETPEGRNAGLVNSITIHAQISSNGFIKTPFYNVYQGQIQKQDSSRNDARPILLAAGQEEDIKIAPSDLKPSKLNFLPKSKIPVRNSSHENEYQRVSREEVEYVALSPIQMISIATSLIPFLEHDDANRALMGSNMQRQAVPLISPERPIIGTGLEARVVADSGHIVQSNLDGYVSYASGKKVVIFEKNNLLTSNIFNEELPKIAFANKPEIRTKPLTSHTSLRDVRLTNTPLGCKSVIVTPKSRKETANRTSDTNISTKCYRTSQTDFHPQYTLPHIAEGNVGLTNLRFVSGLYQMSGVFVNPKEICFFLQTPEGVSVISTKANNYQISKINGLKISSLINEVFISLSQSSKDNKVKQPYNKRTKLHTSLTDTSNTSYTSHTSLRDVRGLLLSTNTKKCYRRDVWDVIVTRQLITSLEVMLGARSSFLRDPKVSVNVKNEKFFIYPFLLTKLFTHKLRSSYIRTQDEIKKHDFIKEVSSEDSPLLVDIPLLRTGNVRSKPPSNKTESFVSMSGVMTLLKNGKEAKPKIKESEYLLQNYQRSNQDTSLAQRPSVLEGEWVQRGDLLADCTTSVSGELSLGKNILVAYMPWEGYNFEDAILISERLVYDHLYTSLHIERYEIEIRDTMFGVEQISNKIADRFFLRTQEIDHLDEKGIAKIGSWVNEGDILVGKITPIKSKYLSPHEKLLYDIFGKKIPTTSNTSLRVPKGVEGKVLYVEILETENIPPGIAFEGPGRVHIYLAEKRNIQVGDKMSGRHGNKGIVSKILPRQDMPYLPNGAPIDMVLNPLGVPSRMNVGQVFEALLGLAGLHLNQSFKIPPFDETYGPEASRSIVYSKLYEARLRSGQKWLFNPNFPGKTRVFDGRTGQCFDQSVTVGQPYMLKLVHLVDDKIHARSTGPYSLVTQQPLRGRSKHGGQRLGEMEVWALEGFGAAYTLNELLTIKSDDINGRHQVMNAILNENPINLGTPESFRVLIRELQSLCLDVDIKITSSNGQAESIDVMKLP